MKEEGDSRLDVVAACLRPTRSLFSMPYDTLPTTATVPVERFQVSITDSQLEELQQLLRLGRLAPPTYENAVQQEGQFGVTREWMSSTRDYWVNKFDW